MNEKQTSLETPKIKFIAYVHLLDALVKAGLLNRDPENRNNIIEWRDNELTEDGIVSGWFSVNIFTAAQELFDSEEDRKELYAVLKEEGYKPLFTKDGEFMSLEKRRTNHALRDRINIERALH